MTISWPQWHLLLTPKTDVEALVVILFFKGERTNALRLMRQWTGVIPHCAFAGLEIDPRFTEIGFTHLRRMIGVEASRLGVGTNQLIMIGMGPLGRCALDLAARGVVPGISAIIIDIPDDPVATVPAPAVRTCLRFVQYRSTGDVRRPGFDAMVRMLRRSCFDVRVVALSSGPDPATRAIGGFLVELVANAGHYRSRSLQ